MLRSSSCDYADAYMLVKGKITITGVGDNDAATRLDEKNKGVIFNSCAPFTKCISRIKGTETDNAEDIWIAMLMYNLIEYSDSYSKTSGSLWHYYKDDTNDNITQSESYTCKINLAGKPPVAGNTNNVEIAVPLKYLSKFWRILEMLSINCEVNLILTWSKDCVISSATGETKFKVTDAKLYVPVITLSTEDNAKLQQLKSGFQRTINWNKYQSDPKTYPQKRY